MAGGYFGFQEFTEAVREAEAAVFAVSQADLIIVNDAYRPTPTALIIDWLTRLAILNEKTKFLVATGTHSAPDDKQLEKIFGVTGRKFRERIVVHDCRDYSQMEEVGLDSQSPVYLNRHFMYAEKVVAISSVEPHYFAGFTGGRKSIFPGLCDYDSTVRNHNLAVSPEAAPMKLQGNPVENHLQKLMALVTDKPVLGIQVVMGPEENIHAIYVGQLQDAFDAARLLSGKVFGCHTDLKFDLILAEVSPPLDANLYQLQKSLENSQAAVRDGGTILLFSPCREGIGSDAFYRLAESVDDETAKTADSRDRFGIHKITRTRNIARRINIYLYSELAKGIPERVYYRSTRNPQEVIDKALSGRNSPVIGLVHDAGHTVLISD